MTKYRDDQQRPYMHLERELQKKQPGAPIHPADYNGMAFPGAILMLDNGFVNFENVLQYEFYNLSNVPVMINGMFLDRYFAGSPTAPTYLTTRYFWIPKMNCSERDTSNYTVEFLNTYYNVDPVNILPFRRLFVCKKMYAPVQPNREL